MDGFRPYMTTVVLVQAYKYSAMANINILHLTPHLGGGVGGVILNYLANDRENAHAVACLDTANEKAKAFLAKAAINFCEQTHRRSDDLQKAIESADLVVVHFWNHPLLYDLLVNSPLPPARMAFWAHTSGLNPPYVHPKKLFDYADRFVFTTSVSLETEEMITCDCPSKLSVILSTSGIERFANLIPNPHAGFNIGFVGTADYSKLHPDFVALCAKIAQAIPDARFYVLSGDSQDRLKRDAKKHMVSNRFVFLGRVDDIATYLRIFDIFGYPLNPHHFGTAEQVLQEAMAASLVPVVLNNRAEVRLVGEAGVVADNPGDYVDKVIALSRKRSKLPLMGAKARQYAIKNFSFPILRQSWQKLFVDLLAEPKREHRWNTGRRLSPYEVFLESLGKHAKLFTASEPTRSDNLCRLALEPTWTSESKGTPFQYAAFFPEDSRLAEICRLMKGAK
jgi:glycosyltransferase involved in cell wall biosynthesis